MSPRAWFTLAFGSLALAALSSRLQTVRVGELADAHVQADGSVTRGQGRLATMRSRPVDLALSPDARWAAVKDSGGLKLVDVATARVTGSWTSNEGTSPIGLAWATSTSVWVTTAGGGLQNLEVGPNGTLADGTRISLGDGFPCGLVLLGEYAYVALSTKNQVAEVDLLARKVTRTIDVAVAPFGLALDKAGSTLFVSQQGGVRPEPGQESAPSAGTPVLVDSRGVAVAGALGQVDLRKWTVVRQVPTPTLPSSVVYDPVHKVAVVACANGDSLVQLDPRSGATQLTRLGAGDFAGAAPTGLGLQGDRLYVTLAGTNEVVELRWEDGRHRPVAWGKTDWFPIAVAARQNVLAVASTKGLGSRSPAKPGPYNSYDYTGTVRFLDPAAFSTRRDLPPVSKATAAYPPVKHVVYVIKENRTYDQVLGDMPEGDGDEALCQFPQAVTPNHHAIARRWVLLDNYYCSGVLSADGHSWATEGNTTPYLERSFGGFKRSYTFGDDPLTYSSTGFIWDPFLDRGLTFRNYGEFDYAEPTAKTDDKTLYLQSLSGRRLDLKGSIGVSRVKRHSNPVSPGWNMAISDQYRFERWLEDFDRIKALGNMPNLSVIYLPQDHVGGPVSPQAHVADNDLAVGRLIQALSDSQFWKDTVVFVNEDDPQAGTDHVDGHRSICLVAGGYVKRGAVLKNFYTQASVLHTICDLFGMPPLNLKTALAPPMVEVFSKTPDLAPFTAVIPSVSLTAGLPPSHPYFDLVAKLDLRAKEVQTPREMDLLNRAVWSAARPGERYPSEWAGAHGRGLAARGLGLAGRDDE